MSPRGTTNRNERGSVADRRARREWLLLNYRADVDLKIERLAGIGSYTVGVWRGNGDPACRCYRCGHLLTVDTMTVDRIIPGCKGGTYRRDNIRPCCAPCNIATGNALQATRREA